MLEAELGGIQATRRIMAAGLDARVLVVTTFDLDEYVFAALRAVERFVERPRPDPQMSNAEVSRTQSVAAAYESGLVRVGADAAA